MFVDCVIKICFYNILIFFATKSIFHSLFVCFLKVDPGNTGRVGPTEAALFLKKSGLPDITLGKVSVRVKLVAKRCLEIHNS